MICCKSPVKLGSCSWPGPGRVFSVFSFSMLAVTLLRAGEPVQLTNDGKFKLSPSFLAGGAEVVFSVHDVPNRVTLTRLKLEDRARTRVFPTLATHQFDGVYSPDSRYLCFSRSSTSPQLELVIVDTREKTEVVHSPAGGGRSSVRCPSFAPDGTRIAFTQSGAGGHQVATVDIRAMDLKLLTDSPGINKDPDYSPDGKHIVFSSSRTGDLEVFVMSADGSDQRRLSQSRGLDMHPAWSPDGERIAFTSMRDGNYEIYVMSADGSGATNVTRNPERDDFATWSPDGERLLLVSERRGHFDLYLIDAPAVRERED